MDALTLLGYFCALLIGLVLGLIGGGGSILTVPVLVYLMAQGKELATAYSLFIVGTSALVGTYRYIRQGLVSYKTALLFAPPAFLGVYLVRRFVVPNLPDPLIATESLTMSRGQGLMLLFALLMLVAAWAMVRPKRKQTRPGDGNIPVANYPLIAGEGLIVGGVTGLVGAGGGFLIIPALVLLAKLPMKLAVGTSLLIISVKSLFGFIGDLQAEQPIDWGFLSVFSALAVVGILIGTQFSKKVPGPKLKRFFGWFVLAMGTIILAMEVVSLFNPG